MLPGPAKRGENVTFTKWNRQVKFSPLPSSRAFRDGRLNGSRPFKVLESAPLS